MLGRDAFGLDVDPRFWNIFFKVSAVEMGGEMYSFVALYSSGNAIMVTNKDIKVTIDEARPLPDTT